MRARRKGAIQATALAAVTKGRVQRGCGEEGKERQEVAAQKSGRTHRGDKVREKTPAQVGAATAAGGSSYEKES